MGDVTHNSEDPIKKRLEKKYSGSVPKWAEDFPIDQIKDSSLSRRDFIRYLSLVSLGFFMGTLGVWIRSFFKRNESAARAGMRIAGPEDLAVGESYVFEIPGVKEHAILVRLEENTYVAYGQKCTHLQCPVIWKREEKILYCPCHRGAFNAQSGDVLAGPPERPLPKLKLKVVPDGIYFAGMERGELI